MHMGAMVGGTTLLGRSWERLMLDPRPPLPRLFAKQAVAVGMSAVLPPVVGPSRPGPAPQPVSVDTVHQVRPSGA